MLFIPASLPAGGSLGTQRPREFEEKLQEANGPERTLSLPSSRHCAWSQDRCPVTRGPQGRGKFRGNGPSGAEPPDPCHSCHFSVSCRVSQVHRKAAGLVSCYFQPNTFPNPCPLAQLLGPPQRVCFSCLSLCNKPPESTTAYKATTTICFAHKPVIWTGLCGDGLSLFQAVSAGEVQQGTEEYASRWFPHITSLSGQLAGENGVWCQRSPFPSSCLGFLTTW